MKAAGLGYRDHPGQVELVCPEAAQETVRRIGRSPLSGPRPTAATATRRPNSGFSGRRRGLGWPMTRLRPSGLPQVGPIFRTTGKSWNWADLWPN